MRVLLPLCIAASLGLGQRAAAAESPVKLYVKPVLCVLDHGETSCTMTFDIRWQSDASLDLCLNDGTPAPLRCWTGASSGEHTQQRTVAEDFAYWLNNPNGTMRLAEVQINVMRVDSADRRRERRARHVWDVL